MTEILLHFTFQIGIILLVAKLFGEIFERLGQSSVLGELIAGMAIGPYALGKVHLPFIGQLFPTLHQVGEHVSSLPISSELYVFAQIGAVILLFLVGLETDAKMFIKYGLKALGVAVGGVIVPFFLGAWGTVLFGFAEGIFDIPALFMGAIMTATSVGITARVLADIYKLDTSEGVSILAAAVIDDVLGILILALVISIANSGGDVSWGELGMIGVKAIGFIGVLTILGLLFAKKLARLLLKLEGKTYVAVAAALCLIIAAIAEEFGLAMIIGAYLAGIIMSVTEIKHELEEKLVWVSHFITPVFFASMGMLVDFSAMKSALVFGLVITLFAIIGKIFGCGIPAYFSGFNFLGASRIGIGMLPRGEVALIVAGIGLTAGIISQEIFGVSIMMTLVTTLMAPLILVPLFKKDKSGLKSKVLEKEKPRILIEPIFSFVQDNDLLNFFSEVLAGKFKAQGYNLVVESGPQGILEFEHGENKNKLATMKKKDKQLTIDCSRESLEDIKAVVEEAKIQMTAEVAKLETVAKLEA